MNLTIVLFLIVDISIYTLCIILLYLFIINLLFVDKIFTEVLKIKFSFNHKWLYQNSNPNISNYYLFLFFLTCIYIVKFNFFLTQYLN